MGVFVFLVFHEIRQTKCFCEYEKYNNSEMEKQICLSGNVQITHKDAGYFIELAIAF